MLSRIPGARIGRSWITAVGRSQRALASESQELVLMEPLREKGVAVLTLNRPKALNALSDGLMRALAEKLQQVDADSTLRAAVVTGTGKAFAAGADIKEMHSRSDYSDVRQDNMLAHWSAIASIRKPIVAAVGGFALGGGCELAMSCDIIIASEAAKFGQPEIKLGTIPGVGGTQRLVRAIGKSKAMELVLTGEMLSAEEAEKAGLVSRVVAQGAEVEEALRVAEKIASFSSPVVQLAKECINASAELSLTEGLRRVLLFHPRHFGCLYPWPVHHPQDRQSRVDFDAPDLAAFPRFAELRGQALEAILCPGDVLHLPPGWWHHIEMLPSPADEVVSINFWYPPPTWFHGNLAQGEIDWDRPLYGVRRMLFQRCVEELVAQMADPSKVQQILELAVQESPSGPVDQSLKQALAQLDVFLGPVFADPHERRKLLREVLEGRFERLA